MVAELAKLGERVDAERIGERLSDMSLFLELRARSAAELASLMPPGVNKREVLAMLPELVDAGFVRRARQVRCPECRYRVLLDLYEQDELMRCAVGGYGTRVFAFLPHVPVEWAGIAAGGAGWLIDRSRRLTFRERSGAILLIAGLLACAAVVETCLAPHR